MEINLSGIQNLMDVNATRGERIASKGTDDPQFEKDMVDLSTDPSNMKAQTAVIKTQDKMLGALLDIFS